MILILTSAIFRKQGKKWARITMTMTNFVGLLQGLVYGNYKAGLPHLNIAEVIVDLLGKPIRPEIARINSVEKG
jgi:hypothetical protein